jgi:hypothetical protein
LTGGLVDGGQGGDSDIENAGHMHVVPLFLLESVNTILHHQALVCFRFGAAAKGYCLVPPPPGANTIHKKSAGSHPLVHRSEIASQEESALRKHLRKITYAFLFFYPFFLNKRGFFPAVMFLSSKFINNYYPILTPY